MNSNMQHLSYYLNDVAKQNGVRFSGPALGDAGFDLPCSEETIIEPNTLVAVPTGVHLAIPTGWVGLVRDRSSVALKGGVTSAGVIDAGYRGEVKVVMHNLGQTALRFTPGDRIAQCLLLPHFSGDTVEEVSSLDDLGNTARGQGGFGSTGV